MIQKLLHNPWLLKLVLVTACCLLLFLLAAAFIRKLRKNISAEVESFHAKPQGNTAITLAAYEGVIRQLRDQGKELQRAREGEQQQATLTDNISEAVLSNLSCGVVFFDRMGLVRQANRAAKSLLGYASPFSFHLRELFRGMKGMGRVFQGAATVDSILREDLVEEAAAAGLRSLFVGFETLSNNSLAAANKRQNLGRSYREVVRNKNEEILGVSCLINDLTELTELSQQAQRNENLASLGEISAGLVNDFKKSLKTISGHAEMLMREDESTASRYYAEKILSEAESLSRIVSEFLEFASSPRN